MSNVTAPQMTTRLSTVEVARFRDEGYLLPGRQLFPAADFAELRATFERLLTAWTDQGGRPEHMDVPHFYYPELMRWLLHPAALDLVESLIGPDIVLFSSHFICKPAFSGRRVPWHEDSAYWKGQWDPMDVVTIWLAIDDSTPENGNMRVIPGSHVNGYSEYADVTGEPQVFSSEIKSGTFDEGRAVNCALQAGTYSLHHGKMIHGSEVNRSAHRRCGYTMRYISAGARFHPEHNSDGRFQIYLGRGRDRAGNTYADPTRVNERWLCHYGIECPKGH